MGEGATPGDGKTSPFGNGKGATMAGAAGGGHDFTKEPESHAPSSGGRDFTKESRPQSMARAEVVPNPQEIPAGGKVLKADPGPVSKTVAGSAPGPQPPKPFRVKG